MLKKKLSTILWLTICSLPVFVYYADYYAPKSFESALFARIVFYFAFFSLLYILSVLYNFVFVSPFVLFGSKKTGFLRISILTLLTSVFFILLGIDAHVYALYHFHMNYAMFDLMINSKGQVIQLSEDTYISIAVEIGIIILYSLLAVCCSSALGKRYRTGKITLVMLLAYLLVNGVNVYGNAVANQQLIEIANRVPLYFPLSMNTQLADLGIISKSDLAKRRVSIGNGDLFDYPKKPLTYTATQTNPLNVLIIAVDCLRFDMLDEKVMPHTYAFSRKAMVFNDYWSSGNATRSGIFGLFYGIPPSYWDLALRTGKRAAVVEAALSRGYRVQAFGSATLTKPEFNQTVFAGVPQLRIESDGNNAVERDLDCVEDFAKFLNSGDTRPFVSFIFFDNLHSYEMPKDAEIVFRPYHEDINYMDLKVDTDPLGYLNLYRNVAHYSDTNIEKVLKLLETSGKLDNTIVFITADHGQEFNETGLNFWGHNGNYTKYQIHVPLVVYWPGRGSGQINERAVSYDVSSTLLQDLFEATNDPRDYGVGQNLFALKPIDFFLAGSYMETAIVEASRITMIDNLGLLYFKDNNWRDSDDKSRSKAVVDGILQLQEYKK